MPLLFSVVPLRKGGVRIAAPGHPCTGYLRSEREGACIALTVISYQGGIPVAGPLYEARIVRADQDGFIVQGIERDGQASVVQEWLLKQFGQPAASNPAR